jgi:hypothetical protein
MTELLYTQEGSHVSQAEDYHFRQGGIPQSDSLIDCRFEVGILALGYEAGVDEGIYGHG